MIYLYFVRHGETIFNVYRRMQGWCDTPLTNKGIRQAECVAIGLSQLPISKVYSSDSGRAMQTAEAIAKQVGLPVIPLKGLREMFFGTMEGLDTNTGHKNQQEYRDTYGWIDVGGEDWSMLEKRISASINTILSQAKNEDQHFIVVSHGLTIKAMMRYVAKKSFQSLKDFGDTLDNASVTTICYESGHFKITDFNNTKYLEIGGGFRNEKNH